MEINTVAARNAAQFDALDPLLSGADAPAITAPAAGRDVMAFGQALAAGNDPNQTGAASCAANATDCEGAGSGSQQGMGGQMPEQAQDQLMQLILQLVQQLLQSMLGGQSGKTEGGSTASPTGSVTPVDGSGRGGSAGADELIPKPTEHLQTLNLGGKQVTVGGDGSASAEEVQAVAGQISHLYDSSSSFRNMIDNSSDPSFEVSVGRRSDNTSWGNTEGRVFMNINNVAPGNSDSFQSLLGHEFAHASIDLGHGAQMEQLQAKVASEG
ncbi:MAG: hypothetical protein R3E95_02240 [Thiolinea sp.]